MKSILLKVEEGIYEGWRKDAKERGMSMSAWIRWKCSEEVKREAPAVKAVALPKEEKAVKAEVPLEKAIAQGRMCVHGMPKGFNCWKCGGMAVMGGKE